MSLPYTVADVIQNHVTLTLESLDRIYLNVIQQRLQLEKGITWFFCQHRQEAYATAKVMSAMTRRFVTQVERFCDTHHVPLITFEKGQRKDDLAQQYHAKRTGTDVILFVGKAQEKATVIRTYTRTNPSGRTSPALMRSTAMVNQYYFYGHDDDFGPFFIKFSSYFPYNAKICLNGHEWLKRQLTKKKIAFEALDNGIRSCADPVEMQRLAESLGEEQLRGFWQKWARRLPHPFTLADRAAGYRYELFVQQVELARTQVFDHPRSGRLFFEQMLRDHLDLGRPQQLQLIFDRRVPRTKTSRFRTRLVTQHVTPSLCLDYKHSCLKQYFKEERALRTELVVNHTRDFGLGKALPNLPALRTLAFAATRRLLHVQQLRSDPTLGEKTFRELASPTQVEKQRVSGLRFGDPTVMALMIALLMFRFVPRGFRGRDLRPVLAALLDDTEWTAGRMTYHLRRLRLKGLIERMPHSQRYQLTEAGLRAALCYSVSYTRVILPLASQLHQPQLRKQCLNALKRIPLFQAA
jgi:DNA-binding MarR family transcriptional regulator